MATPAHPYDLSTLNGIKIDHNNFSVTTNAGYGSSTAGPEFTSNTSGYNVYVSYFNHASYDTNAVVSYQHYYTAGSLGPNGNYYLPTFGKITFQNSIFASYSTLYIHGLQSNGSGLLLSSYGKLGFAVSQYNSAFNNGPVEYVHTINNYGHFGDVEVLIPGSNLAAGKSSLAYNNKFIDQQGIEHYIYTKAGYTASDGSFVPSMMKEINADFLNNLNPPFTPGSNFPIEFTNQSSVYSTTPCFVAGTRVATVRGAVAVEELAVGDEVVTASGETRPVIWIGSRRVRPPRHPRPDELHPVRVRAHAFGAGRPARDLRLSPGHSVAVDGWLVPVALLVNGATVVQEEVERVRYVHVELDAHDVLLAEGLPCESYLDDGNRDAFANAEEHAALHGRLDPVGWERACAPVLHDRAAQAARLLPIQSALAEQAEALGWRRAVEPGLTGEGAGVTEAHRTAERLWLRAPADAALILASRAGRPVETVPGLLDHRRLGVRVGEVRVDGRALDLAGPAFGPGFHGVERLGDLAWRWTDGSAELRLDGAPGATVLVEVALLGASHAWIAPDAAPGRRLSLVPAA